jgi:Leucine-rich repeat (LRR) protein
VLRLDSSLLQLGSFAHWLPAHAGLIKSLSITENPSVYPVIIQFLDACVHYRTAHQLLQQAIQVATLCTGNKDSAAAAAAAAIAAVAPGNRTLNQQQQQQQQQQSLQLVSFYSNCFGKPGALGVLAALPAHSMKQLSLSVSDSEIYAAPVSAALTRLTCLQQLRLTSDFQFDNTGNHLAGLSQLSQLTSLWIDGDWHGSLDDVQQLLAQPLLLRQLHLHPHSGLPILNLSHLKQLERLDLWAFPVGSVLPLQLKQLYLEARTSADVLSAVLPLQQLQRLSLAVGFTEHQPLLQLAQLPSLQHISLDYRQPDEAVGGSAAWRHLPLQELSLAFNDYLPRPEQMATLLDAVADCTQLTKLKIEACAFVLNDDNEEDPIDVLPVAACGKLACLKHLKSLCITEVSKLVPGDVLYLTALTGLTRLELAGLGPAVDDVAANALACSLKQLQHLDLARCELGSMVCAAAIGHLTQLTALNLSGNSGVTRERLMLLTGLSRLQRLGLDSRGGAPVSDAVLRKFWAAVAAAAAPERVGDPPRRWGCVADNSLQEECWPAM